MEKQMSDPDTRIVLNRHGNKIRRLELNDETMVKQLKHVTDSINKILVILQMIQARESTYDAE